MLNILKSLYYEIKSYFVATPNPYIRTGSCNKCGKCCHTIYSADAYTEKEFKIMQFIYPPYRRFYIKGKDDNGNFIFTCKYIKKNGECSVYDKRPKICRQYPTWKRNFSAVLPDGCGYKFVNKKFVEFLNKDDCDLS